MKDLKLSIVIEAVTDGARAGLAKTQAGFAQLKAHAGALGTTLAGSGQAFVSLAATAGTSLVVVGRHVYSLMALLGHLGMSVAGVAAHFLGLTVRLESHSVKLNAAAQLIEKFHFETRLSLGFLRQFAAALEAIHFPIQPLIDFIDQMAKANIVLGIGRGKKKVEAFDGLADELDKVKTAFRGVAGAVAAAKNEIKQSLAQFGAAVAAEAVIEWRGVKFEAAFADVKKVVSGSSEEIARLRAELQAMAGEIAMPIEGLAKMQAIAGQLGFPVDQIADFVRLTAKGAVAFEMLPEQAAESFGNLRNIYDLNLQELEFFGDQVNYIADKANTNESALLNVMNRAGGVAQRFGLLRGESIALAAAMLSMGKPPELVGTALDMLLSRLQNAKNQSKDFQIGLQLLGTDAKTLAEAIAKHPKQALDDFLLTLSKLSPASQTDILSRLIGEAGEAKGVIGDLIGKLGEYQRLTALSTAGDIAGSMEATFQERQKTVESAVTQMKNAWDTLAISASTLFLPTIRAVAAGFRDLAIWLRQVNEEYPHLAGFTRIALIFGTLGNVINAVFKGLPALASKLVGQVGVAFAGSLSAGLRAGLAALPALVAPLMNSFFGRLIAGAALLSVGFNGVLAAISALSAGFVALVSSPVNLLVAGLGIIGVRVALARGAFAALGAATSGLGSILLRLVGGPVGLAVSALAFLAIKYQDIKDVTFKFGAANVTLAEILGATWRLIKAMFADLGGFMGLALKDMGQGILNWAGISDSAFLKAKLAGEGFWRDTKTMINAVIGAFDGMGKAVGVAMAVFVGHLRTEFAQAVALAQAAGKDIQAAWHGDFSGANFNAQLEGNARQDQLQAAASDGAIRQALLSGQGKDYLGEASAAIAEGAKTAADAVGGAIVQYGDSWAAVVNAEILAQRAAAPTVTPAERPPAAAGIDLPELATPVHKQGGGAAGQESEMHRFEANLEQRKIAFETQNALLEFSKAQEKQYWDEVIASYQGNAKTLADLKKKSADLELQMLRDTAKQSQELLKEQQQAEHDAAMDAVAAKLADAQQQYELGQISQLELLTLERQYARESYEIAATLAKQKRDLTQAGTVERAQAENAMLQATRDFVQKDTALGYSQAQAKLAQFKDLLAPFENALEQMTNGVLSGQQTLKNAVRNAAQSMVVSYASSFIKTRIMAAAHWAWEVAGFAGKEAKLKAVKSGGLLFDSLLWAKQKVLLAGQWLWETLGFGTKEASKVATKVTSETAQTGAQLAGDAVRTASTITAGVTKIAITETTAKKSIMTYALEAAAGAYSALAGIPLVGPVLGAIAAAVAFAAVAGFGVLVGSAKGGEWQVDKDGSPYILHENESVLPAGVADNFRKVVNIVQSAAAPADPGPTVLPPNSHALLQGMIASGQLTSGWSVPRSAFQVSAESQQNAMALVQKAKAHEAVALSRRQESPAAGMPHGRPSSPIHFSPTYHASFIDTRGAERFFKEHGDQMVKRLSALNRRGAAKL